MGGSGKIGCHLSKGNFEAKYYKNCLMVWVYRNLTGTKYWISTEHNSIN
jgi:hypothetical protein